MVWECLFVPVQVMMDCAGNYTSRVIVSATAHQQNLSMGAGESAVTDPWSVWW
jgi:hypothetical protein